MGSLGGILDIGRAIEVAGITQIVETGTGVGGSLRQMIRATPDSVNIYTVELMDELWGPISEEFADNPRVHTLKGYSHEVVSTILSQLTPDPCLWWHDAHFPGADFQINGATYGSEADPVKRIPLEAEMAAISASDRDISKDIFIIDDLRIYCDRPFHGGLWDQRSTAGGIGYWFVGDALHKTHTLYESMFEQGMIVAIPFANEEARSVVRDRDMKASTSYD